LQLRDRVAFVTGGSGDLGAEIAVALARAGCSVVLSYATERQRAETAAARVEEIGREALVVQLDQADPEMPEAVIEAIIRRFGRLDILINNAAWNIGIPFPDLDALTPAIWDRIQNTNLRGPYLLARAAARPMREQGEGRIVNVASIGGIYPGSSSIAYSCSKAGLIHLTRCLAVALAPAVLVNCVAPGLIEGTRMARRLPPQVLDMARRSAVLGRAASLEDLADQVLTFCRTDSATGQVVPVDGGFFPH
jgi:3-oxoacyl-[acyl-carrier protein] reductase